MTKFASRLAYGQTQDYRLDLSEAVRNFTNINGLDNNNINTIAIDRAIRCEKKAQNESFMMCPMCVYYPCQQLTKSEIYELNISPLMERTIIKLKPRRCRLYIIKYLDGTLKEAPDLNPADPDKILMQNVDTVYQIGKELVPVIVLKPKPKEVRKKIAQNESGKTKKPSSSR